MRPRSSGLTTPLTQVCWLNRTLKSVAHLPALAEVAQDSNVERIGLPRLLRQEATAKPLDVLGATAFRIRTKLTGKGIAVAVLDTEIAHKHKAFQGRIILKENFTQEPWGHPHSHGTAVAGLLAARSPTLLGIAPEATIYHYKVLATNGPNNADDFGGSLAIQRALEDGAQIANCSWGIGPADHGTSREARAFDQAWVLGLVIVKSAGNEGSGGLTSPADAKGVVVVGATDRAGKSIIPESSRGLTPNGRTLDCVAPGGSADDFLASCKIDGKIGRVGFGTSFAAPQVAGLLALLLEQDPHQTPDQLRTALLELCRKLPGVNAKSQGHGLPVLS
jgi:serine protease AprX